MTAVIFYYKVATASKILKIKLNNRLIRQTFQLCIRWATCTEGGLAYKNNKRRCLDVAKWITNLSKSMFRKNVLVESKQS